MAKTQLNPSQLKACRTINGRILVLAGAGSGKTSVLTERIVHLIGDHKVQPGSILGLTFTNKAAAEMRQRIAKKIGRTMSKDVILLTFHSFCLNILKKEIHHLGYTNSFSLYDEKDKMRLEGEVYDKLSEEQEEEGVNEDLFREKMNDVLKAYNAVDFDGLLELTVALFKQHPEVRKKYEEKFHYVMIDEYQDTNPIQYELIKLLTQKRKNLFVVGDDDQAIYGFRGAEVDHILSFPHDTSVKLEENYRSTQQILNVANAIIAKNSKRHEKELFSQKKNGNKPHIFHAPTEKEEAESIIRRILYLKEHKNLNWSDFAILYRSNNLSRTFEVALMQASYREEGRFVRSIPYHVVQGTSFYERAEVKDLFAYLKVLNNPKDTTALFRILNYPKRGISTKTIEALNKEATRMDCSVFETLEYYDHIDISAQGKIGISIFNSIMDKAKSKRKLANKVQFLIDELDLKCEIEKEVKSDQARIFKWDNIQTCLEMAETADEEGASLSDFVNGSILDEHSHSRKKNKEGVNLLTFHSAKGLEFKACFIVSLEDGLIPHERSLEEGNIEEERRLFYVAITRAKKYLYLSMARSRLYRGKPMNRNASRFLFEIPKELLEFEAFNNHMPLD
ncbi:MAG: ATP-dependent DNA helicase PcrA [Chlamydiia bacterium]|nr:ATP-dependent DNA helicase PcrA [Chlamydiia bacterium]